MSVQPIAGFPLSDDYAVTRVPNVALGRMLANVDDSRIIKLVLRAIWLIERQRGYPRYITEEHLRRDRVLSVVLPDERVFTDCLKSVFDLGVLVEVPTHGTNWIMLNTESALRAVANGLVDEREDSSDSDGWDEPASSHQPANAFRAYEENIGALSPMIRESILAALEDFTDEDISRAVRIAVENETRSWAFINGVLRRWLREGVPHEPSSGQSARGSGRARISQAELGKYLERQRKQIREESKKRRATPNGG